MARLGSFLRFTVAVVLLDVGCGGGDGGTPPTTRTIEKPSPNGDHQTGNAGQPLPTPFAVLVKENGSPKAGVTVTWTATVGGGAVASGTSTTTAEGIALTVLTLGSDSVVQRVTATLANASGSPQTFNATARIQGATQIALAPANSGNGQTDTVLATLLDPYRVILRDEGNNPVTTAVTVSWSVPGGQGSVSSGTSVSDAAGIAAMNRILGSTAGTQTAQASVKGLLGTPVGFTATGTAGDAFAIAAGLGGGARVVTHMFLETVIAQDKYGNPKEGVVVTWAAQPGSGSFNPTQITSGPNGIAPTTRMLGATPGNYTDTAYADGLQGSPVLFPITAVVAPPPTAAVDVGNIFFKSSGNTTQNPAVDTILAGGRVTWNWVGGGHRVESTGSPSFVSGATQTSGSYEITFINGGTYTYDCGVHGAAMTGRVVVIP